MSHVHILDPNVPDPGPEGAPELHRCVEERGSSMKRWQPARWYVWHMDDGIVGVYPSKKAAMRHCNARSCHRIECGGYETVAMYNDGERHRTYVIGSRETLIAMGVPVPIPDET